MNTLIIIGENVGGRGLTLSSVPGNVAWGDIGWTSPETKTKEALYFERVHDILSGISWWTYLFLAPAKKHDFVSVCRPLVGKEARRAAGFRGRVLASWPVVLCRSYDQLVVSLCH